jgi:hypothetical protein
MNDQTLREVASWIAILGTCALAAFFFGFLVFHSLKRTSSENSWFLTVIQKHFAATIAVPLSAISSACIVLLLGTTLGGDLSFKLLVFGEFKGASGPVTLWLLCFVAMILAVKLLWRADEKDQ